MKFPKHAYVWIIICAPTVVAAHIATHPFDRLYPETESTRLINCFMQIWAACQDLKDKQCFESYEYEYYCNAMIGQLMQGYDTIRFWIDTHQQKISADNAAYCMHIVSQIKKEAHSLQTLDNSLVYARLNKQLNKIVELLTYFL